LVEAAAAVVVASAYAHHQQPEVGPANKAGSPKCVCGEEGEQAVAAGVGIERQGLWEGHRNILLGNWVIRVIKIKRKRKLYMDRHRGCSTYLT
jgi:hypothetical protein